MRSQYISLHLSNVCISKGKNIQVGSNKNVVQRITSMVVRIMYKELLFYENNYYILN
jgi:spore coat polysaccharide biosynthesis protein SpsF (cytidylyltransferase family)